MCWTVWKTNISNFKKVESLTMCCVDILKDEEHILKKKILFYSSIVRNEMEKCSMFKFTNHDS